MKTLNPKGFSVVLILFFIIASFGAYHWVNRMKINHSEVAAKVAKKKKGTSESEFFARVRMGYVKKCQKPDHPTNKQATNFFKTCLGVSPEGCEKVVGEIIAEAQEIAGKPYTWNGIKTESVKPGDAIEVKALERVPESKQSLKRCQRNP